MKCPTCKNNIPDNSLRCPHCKTRTGLICKNCHSVNTISDVVCQNCGEEILRLCPECSCVNFPNAKQCRKCGYTFNPDYKMKRISPEKETSHTPNQHALSQKEAEIMLEEVLLSGDKKIISLSGTRGVGKSHVLAKVIQKLKDNQFVWFYGKCTPLTQLTPGGLIQDMIFNLYNLPNFCLNNDKFKKDAVKLFRNKFPYLTNEEVDYFLNFLYPANFGLFENISRQKRKTFELLNKIFDNIVMYSNFIIVADNFDSVDALSYEFLNSFIKKESIYKKLKLLLIYSGTQPSKSYFNIPVKEDNDIYFDMHIVPLSRREMLDFLSTKDTKSPEFPDMEDVDKEIILSQSKGNCSYIEQACGLRLDSQIADCPFVLPETYEELVAERIKLLEILNKEAYIFITSAAILGDKINLQLVKQLFEYDDNTFNDIITYLKKVNFIAPLNDIFCQFKDLLLWETMIETAKQDEQYIDLNTKICNALENFIPNSNAIFERIAQNIKNPQLALDIWTRGTRIAAYIGDMSLYAISQKQCLAVINEMDETTTLKIRYNISERLGRLLTDFNPAEAMDYLPDAIANAKALEDLPRQIDLLGCLSKCCNETGNYLGNVECVDTVLETVPSEKKLEIALLKCAKLKSLLAIGNCGQIVNMIDNEILPVFEELLTKEYTRKDYPFSLVSQTWLNARLLLAQALVQQGNDRSFKVLTEIFDIVEKTEYKNKEFLYKCKLTLAGANTMKGDFETSEKILAEIMKEHDEHAMEQKEVVKWNYINVINNFMRHKYKDLQEDMFHIVTYANNCGDNFTKNILKSILGKILKDSGKIDNAMKIYQEQIAYFSKEKMAIGALLTWYFIAEATIQTEGAKAASEIAVKALDVAQNPKISNYFFEILFQMLLAKTHMETSDFESAKMYIKKSIDIAKQYNMNDILSRLYLLYGKYFHEMGIANTEEQAEYLKGAKEMFGIASNLIKQTHNIHVQVELEQAKSILKSFVTANKISL